VLTHAQSWQWTMTKPLETRFARNGDIHLAWQGGRTGRLRVAGMTPSAAHTGTAQADTDA